MYLDKLPGLQARITAYQMQTLSMELYWSVARPVPTARRSERGDYWFSHGRVESDGERDGGATLAVFMTNPNERLDLCNPHSSMLMCLPGLNLADTIGLFHSHIHDDGTAVLPFGINGRRVRVIKGVTARDAWAEEDAQKFNFCLNKEIVRLFYLAYSSAHLRIVQRAELDYILLSLFDYPG